MSKKESPNKATSVILNKSRTKITAEVRQIESAIPTHIVPTGLYVPSI